MRIISQGGRSGLPYEEIAVCMSCEDIIARHNDKEYLMARYSTMEKAKKAMEIEADEVSSPSIAHLHLTDEDVWE